MKKLQLILTDPCSQTWDDMHPIGTGRYCDSCEKHVLDLTSKSDAELIQFFKRKKDNVCGRLLTSQLNRELILPATKPTWQWLLPLAMGAIFISPAQANGLRPVMLQNDQTVALRMALVEPTQKPSVVEETISGRVVNELTGQPLTGVKVRQKGFENVLALTDSTGKFELGLTQGNRGAAFTFELNGYSKTETHLTNGMVIKLAAMRTVLLGAITTVAVNQEPLYVVYAGKKSCTIDETRFKEIQADWIEKLKVLKGAEATSLYGSKGANGVILVEIKQAYAKKINFSQ